MAKRSQKLIRFIATLENLHACTPALDWVATRKSMKEAMTCEKATWALWLVTLLAGPKVATPILHRAVVTYLKMLIPPSNLSDEDYRRLPLVALVSRNDVRLATGMLTSFIIVYLQDEQSEDKLACGVDAHFAVERILSDLKNCGFQRQASDVTSMILRAARIVLKGPLKRI